VDIKLHLKTLCERHGPSGYEGPVREAIAAAWEPLVETLEIAKSGSLVGLKRGTGPEPRRRIMLCAHMDEIGLLVSGITAGFLKVEHIGGLDARILPGTPVLVHGKETIPGVVGLYPAHTLSSDQQGKYPRLTDLIVDVALPAERVAALCAVGDVITVDLPLVDLASGRVMSKALDDRACVAALTVCLERLHSIAHSWDVLAVASTQEEVGSRGAKVEAFRLRPDIAIALDVTFALQPGVTDEAHPIGGNPPLSLGANFHPALFDAINAAADRLEMPLPPDPLPGNTGTDAWQIQISQEGIPTALINIPIRNMHSASEMVDLKVIERAGRLLAEFVAGLMPDFLATITWEGGS
jgi:endoglucanase